MGFFYNEVKAEKPASTSKRSVSRAVIPIEAMNQLGCRACPRDADEKKLKSPKMEASGVDRPSVYLLGSGPNLDEDLEGRHWVGPAGSVILSKFSRDFRRYELRFNHITQCSPLTSEDGDLNVDVREIECCRQRIVTDIEKTKPKVIVGVGDQPLAWATGLQANAMRFRGRLIPVRIGRHVCWFYSILWPNFIYKKKQYGKSEYEIVMEHDIARLEKLIKSRDLPEPEVIDPPYDRNLVLIDGTQPGDFQRLERLLADLAYNDQNGVDIETNGLRPYMRKPLIISAAVGTLAKAVAFTIDHPDGWGAESRARRVHDLFAEWLHQSNCKVAHNLSFEQEWLAFKYGGYLLRRTVWADSMAMAHTVDERPGTKSLEVQSILRYGFNLKAQSYVDVRQPEWWLKYPLKDILRYNGMDAIWGDQLARDYEFDLKADHPSQWQDYARKVELAPTLVLTEIAGLPVDLKVAEKIGAQYEKQIDDIESRIRQDRHVKTYVGKFGPFDPGNPKHVLKLLKDVCKRDEVFKVDKATGARKESSDEEVLLSIPEKEVPVIKPILELRGIQKISSTYVEPLLAGRMTAEIDGMIHAKYASMTAVTDRLAAEDPNVQNWPKRKHKEIRGAVVALPGGWIVAADYGQIEFRVVGMASGDRNLVKYCWTGYDVHTAWAEKMVRKYGRIVDWIVEEFEVDWDEKGMKTLRQESKNKWVFPMLFGSSTRSCAANLHLPDDVAEDLGNEFWEEFPEVKDWQNGLMRFYEKHGYVETLSGHRRRGAMTKNEIVNLPIQGTAAEIVKAGMIALSERAEIDEIPELQPRLNVHDDLSSWIDDRHLESRIEVIAYEMCKHRFDFINVPLVVEVSIGQDWARLEEIRKYWSNQLFGLPNPYK